MDKIRILLEKIDKAIEQENSVKDTSIEFTPTMLSDKVDELKEVLEHQPVRKDKEQKKVFARRRNSSESLESIVHKLMEYDNHLDALAKRNS